jgi:hypothetical protein
MNPKWFFRVETLGLRALDDVLSKIDSMREGLPRFLIPD